MCGFMDMVDGAKQPERSTGIYLLAIGLLLACGYIMRLRRELALAQQRGDMYRDIAAELDRRRTEQ